MPPQAQKKRKWSADRPLLLTTLLLVCVGLIMVFSASAMMSEQRFDSAYLFLRRQLLWDLLCVLSLAACMRIDYHRWQRGAYLFLAAAGIFLGGVLVVGRVIKGARRWIHLGFFTFQPSELAKLALILWLASYLDRHKSQLKDWNGILPPLIIVGAICALILKEPDLGTPVMLGAVSFILLFLAGARVKHLFLTLLVSFIPLYYQLFHVGYRYRRLMAFANP